MYKDINKSFREALNSIKYNTLAMDISDKIEDAKENRVVKDLTSKRIEKVNKAFKDEKFDNLTKMRYREFRKYYQKERNAIMSDYNKKMTATGDKFSIIINKINAIHDESERRKIMVKTLSENIQAKNKIREDFKKRMESFTEDFKYRALSSDLKWQYIIYDDMDIN
jgi:hypothetical protein